MKRLLLTVLAAVMLSAMAKAQVTLEQCITSAQDNYPLIKKYELLKATEDIDLAEINNGWLPRIGVYAQGTVQNVVPSFPTSLSNVMQNAGAQLEGLSKLQYKVGIDVSQTVWDGGASKAQREITRQRTEANRAALDVELYGIRQRVESIYFGIMLLESQIEQSELAIGTLDANLERMRSLVKEGVAMRSDADMLEAQKLTMAQQLTQAKAALKGYRQVLSVFTGKDLSTATLQLPSAEMPLDASSARPELAAFSSRAALNDAQRSLVNASLMPKIGVFAQSYYGYPGIDYFKAMMNRELSFNIVAGVKVSWNIDSFYNKKHSLRKLDIANEQIDAERETFLFNSEMQTASQRQEIAGIKALMDNDNRIVELRRNVRTAAESQLRNGIIDATALTTKINDETQAALSASYHSIQYIQAIYNLKNTLNR